MMVTLLDRTSQITCVIVILIFVSPTSAQPPVITNSVGARMIAVSVPEPKWGAGFITVYVAETETTFKQFSAFVAESGHKPATEREKDAEGAASGYSLVDREPDDTSSPGTWRDFGTDLKDDFPVMNVTRADAVAYCKWLSNKEQRRYRLPMVEEWNYACYGRLESVEHLLVSPSFEIVEYANIGDADYVISWIERDRKSDPKFYSQPTDYVQKTIDLMRTGFVPRSDGHALLTTVKNYRPNQFGLYDMIGNVAEMCVDPENDACYACGGSYSAFSYVYRRAKLLEGTQVLDFTVRPSIGFRLVFDEKQ